MNPLLERLLQDHRNLTRLLDLLEHKLDALSDGQDSNFDLEIELLDYIEHYADSVHHPTEDVIFRVARGKAGKLRSVLDRLSEQHGELVAFTHRFRETLEGVIQGEVVTREELVIRGREYVALQHQHIDLEERVAFPGLEACMNDEDWQRAAARALIPDDPLFGYRDYNRFRSLIDFLSANDASD
ncbi:Hemerythrin-like domain [endosymbiont of Ridgeia piscesae]|jgi:hemerythrin-like domain-containing protein|uniref:Hemerythrin-like domain n=2 Tax=endosymbiont of Ridgeia piscesae TaxID=54398 RepID=A0A0T5YWM5_9GAMM|nr:hemerythrin domain-containing protein [endosymbiont of Ridgeia piscesae]KRT54957.1 Hemerythrin-like domain [endosymbiont of Ridgeia piscesae]